MRGVEVGAGWTRLPLPQAGDWDLSPATGQVLLALCLSPPHPHSPSLPAPSISGQVSAEFSHSCHSLSWVIFSCEKSVFFASLRGSQGQRLTVLPPPPAAPWVESLVYCVTSPLISLGLSFLGNLDKMPSRVSFHPVDLGFYVEQLGILRQPFL